MRPNDPSCQWPKGNSCVYEATPFRNIVFVSHHCLTQAYLVAMWTWGLCVMLVTPCGRENTREPQMYYLSDVANRRPMFRVTGEILLAFSCAAPLVLLLSYLI